MARTRTLPVNLCLSPLLREGLRLVVLTVLRTCLATLGPLNRVTPLVWPLQHSGIAVLLLIVCPKLHIDRHLLKACLATRLLVRSGALAKLTWDVAGSRRTTPLVKTLHRSWRVLLDKTRTLRLGQTGGLPGRPNPRTRANIKSGPFRSPPIRLALSDVTNREVPAPFSRL